MQRFQIEVHLRAPRKTLVTWSYVDADTEQSAIEEAQRNFGLPGKDYTFKAIKPPLCAKCGGELLRVPRRLVDRLLSPGRYRYQCDTLECGWTGNLPIEGTSSIWFFVVRGFAAASILVVVAGMAFFMFTIYRERGKDTAWANRDQLPPKVRPAERNRTEAPKR